MGIYRRDVNTTTIMADVRFRRFNAAPKAVFSDLEGCLMDAGCLTTVGAVKQLFKEKGIELSDEEAGSGAFVDELMKNDNTSKKSHLRHVLLTVAKDKWQAATGVAPTEWDLEALFKEFPRAVREEAKLVKAIRGAPDVVSALRGSGTKVALASGFNSEAMESWLRVANANGLEFDGHMSCADVPNPGREGPEPWMVVPPEPWRCYALATRLGIFPLDTCVRLSHTTFGIEEGLNAGMWTVACATTGPVQPLAGPGDTEAAQLLRTKRAFNALGCHYVIDGIWDLPKVMADIEVRMARGDKP